MHALVFVTMPRQIIMDTGDSFRSLKLSERDTGLPPPSLCRRKECIDIVPCVHGLLHF